MRAWFRGPQMELFNLDECQEPILLPANAMSYWKAFHELGMRGPRMITKLAHTFDRYYVMFGGLILERHVSDWFHLHWPEFWRHPDNEGNYGMPCAHDFKLEVEGKDLWS